LENCLSYLTRSAWNKLKAAEEAGGGIEDLDADTQFVLENCLSYKLQRALKRFHDAGENLDLLDADDRELLQKTVAFQSLVLSIDKQSKDVNEVINSL
jgi:hypothetical protein